MQAKEVPNLGGPMSAQTYQSPERAYRDRLKAKFYITPENLGYFIYPMVKFIHEVEPDYIIALDTGARITGFATFILYRELYGNLPSQDHMIHFRRISHNFPDEAIRRRLKDDIDHMLALTSSPTLFILDDWVNMGTTKTVINRVISDSSDGKIQLYFGVMRELLTGVADVRGNSFSVARSLWRHNPNLIGVEYPNKTDVIEPHAVRSSTAITLRQDVCKNMKVFASLLKENS